MQSFLLLQFGKPFLCYLLVPHPQNPYFIHFLVVVLSRCVFYPEHIALDEENLEVGYGDGGFGFGEINVGRNGRIGEIGYVFLGG